MNFVYFVKDIKRFSKGLPLTVGLLFGLAAIGAAWILFDENSPYRPHYWGTIPSFWRFLNFPVLVVLMMTGIDYRPFTYFLFFLQWFLIGYFLVWLFHKIRRHY